MKRIINKKSKPYFCLIMSILMMIPFYIAASHAGYYSDDYMFAGSIRGNWRGSIFSTAFEMGIYRWKTSEGKWFANFYDYYFHPYFWNGMSSLHLFMNVLISLSFVGLFLFCVGLVKYMGLKTEKAYILYLIFLMPVLCYREYWEVYLWFVGSVYQLTTMLFLWGYAFLLLAITYKKTYLYMISGIFLILMGGGMYNFIAVGVLAVFSLLVFEYYRNKKVNIPLLIVFIATCVSSLCTILAPGNFVRKSTGENAVTLLEAIGTSFSVFAYEYKNLLTTTTFLGIAFAMFLFGMKQKVCLDKKIILFTIPVLLLMVYSTILPFVYGYNVRGCDVRYNRAEYLIEVTIIVGTLLVCLLAGMTVKRHKKETEIVLKFSVLFSFLVLGTSFAETIPAKIVTNYSNGKAQRYNEYLLDIIELAENSQGEDIVIEKRMPEWVEGTTLNDLKEDIYYDNNRKFVGLYGNNSISILGEFF